jgi:leucyl-tRNA synthetase
MVPHLAEECWSLTGKESSIANEPWPKVDSKIFRK